MRRKIMLALLSALILGLFGCGSTSTLGKYNMDKIGYITYTDIDTICDNVRAGRN